MFENLSCAIKNKKLHERLRTSVTEHLLSFEAEFERYFPEPKEQEAGFAQNPFSTWMNYKTNFVIFKMIRRHMMLSRNLQSLSFGVLSSNPTHKYPN